MQRITSGNFSIHLLFILLMSVMSFSGAAPAAAQDDFIDIGGKKVDLDGLVFTAPPGWLRAPKEMEKAEGDFMLGLMDSDADDGSLKALVVIPFESDEFKDQAQEKAFIKRVAKGLVEQGWKPGKLTIGNRKLQAFRTKTDDGELILTLVTKNNRIYRLFINVKSAKSIPDEVTQLISAVIDSAGPSLDQFEKSLKSASIRDEMEISNILYGGDIVDDTDIGRATREWHGQLAAVIDENCRLLDRAWDKLSAANGRFDEAVFNLHYLIRNANPKADWLVEAEARLESLVETMLLEQTLRTGIENARIQLKKLNEKPVDSRLAGHLQLTLLDLYAQTGQLQTIRVTEIFSYFTAVHLARLSPMDAGLKKKLAREISEEETAIIEALAADQEVKAALHAVAVGMTGIKDVLLTSLDMNIDKLEQDIVEVRTRLAQWNQPSDMHLEASLIKDVLFLYEEQLDDLQKTRDILIKESRNWVGKLETETRVGGSGRYVMLAAMEPVSSHLMAATAKSDGFTRGARLTSNYTSACAKAAQPEKKVGFFRKAFKVVQNTVGAAANSTSMFTKVIADKYYGWSEGLSEKDTNAQIRQTVKQHMSEWEKGEIGKGAMRQAITGFEAVEKGAEKAVESRVEKVIGKGWISWGAGKVANAAVSSFTGLGKGANQILAHDATAGERVEGVINVVSSLVGGSANASKPLTKNASKAAGQVINQAGKTAKTLVSSKAGIEVEKSIMKTLGQSAIPEAQKNIAKYTAEQIASTKEMQKAMVDGLKKLAEGGAKALSPSNWGAGAKQTLAEAGKNINLKEGAKELLKKLAPGNLVHGAIDNAVAAKAKNLVDGEGGESQAEEQGESPDKTKPGEKTDQDDKTKQESPDSAVRPEQSEKKDKTSSGLKTEEKTGEKELESEENEDADEEEMAEEESAEEDDEEQGEEATGEEFTDSQKKTILDIVTPQKVKAGGTLSVPTPGFNGKTDMVTVTVSITFWNVGVLGGGEYSTAVMTYKAESHGAIESRTMTGTYSGGPNGVINLEDVSLAVSGGSSVSIPEWGSVPILNPDAFAEWPR